MSCQGKSNLIARMARRFLGVPWNAGQSGYLGGSTAQISFFDPQPKTEDRGSTRSKKAQRKKITSGSTGAGNANGQVSFFTIPEASLSEQAGVQAKAQITRREPLPTQRQIKITNDFSAEELQTLSVQLRLGAAAVSRQIRELNHGTSRGIGHSDPRPLDWARADQRNYRFLVSQLDEARRGQGYINTGSLSKTELVDLWEFARFEADRAGRNIDHLQSGSSHLKGPTADYLAGRHKLEARFYTFLAGQLETVVPPEEIEAARAWEG